MTRPAGKVCAEPHTDAYGRSWCCDPYPYAIRPADRPAASGGATDREREEWRPVCGCEQGMGHMDRGCHSYGLCHAQSAERHPAASQADGELREEIAQVVATAGDGYWARADAVLALPAVRQLLADAAKVQRVRDAVDRHADNLSATQREAFARALDGGS